jgi:hypothetical protein
MNEEDLARYLKETVDVVAAVAALPGPALADLADVLYRHLDTPSPAFGARSWYTQVTEELQLRRMTGEGLRAAMSDDPGPAGPAGQEVPAG